MTTADTAQPKLTEVDRKAEQKKQTDRFFFIYLTI